MRLGLIGWLGGLVGELERGGIRRLEKDKNERRGMERELKKIGG